MKNSKLFLLLTLIFCFIFVGCSSQIQNSFPQELVGTWKAEGQSGWQFTFDENGEMTELMHFFGGAKLILGQAIENPISPSGNFIYEPSQCIVAYLPQDKELAVNIEMANISIGEMLQGTASDSFAGILSDDLKIWTAQWYSDLKLFGIDPTTGEKIMIPQDRPADVPMELTFTKLPAGQKK